MITTEFKLKVVKALANRRENFGGSDAKFAASIGISGAQYSRIKNGDTDKVLSDSNWISLARTADVQLNNLKEWKVAVTPTFEFVMAQLNFCQENAASRILCDAPDIGKTFTARHYVRNNKNAIYIDCSQVKSRQKLVRMMAREFGVGSNGKYSDVYADLVFYLRSLPNPLIILDEAGDLEYQAWLELKALWNATERSVGWYMMGADGLRAKMRRSIDHKKVGYAEIFSRYGNVYQRATPETTNEINEFKTVQCAMVVKVNAPQTANLQSLIVRSDASLRRIYDELNKVAK